MTGGYDEWARARTPSLLAFASGLVEDAVDADAAVTGALDRMRSTWSRSSREDPDLEARRHVIRACGSPRRAAVVLRLLEDRSDAEIADVLRCSQSAARRHLQRGLAEVRPQAGSLDALARARQHVVARAASAPTQLLTRDPSPASARRSRRPPGSRVTLVTVVAVIALVGGVAYVAHESRKGSGMLAYPEPHAPASWRYESYDGVQVQVPGTWGWGASPIRAGYFDSQGHLGACGTATATVTPSAADTVSPLVGFVGRPAMVTERCMSWGADGSVPTGDAVWFDSPYPVGQKVLGPTVAETRAVGDQRVTAFSPQPGLRRQILGTATQVDVDANGCPTRAVAEPEAGPGDRQPDSLSVCVYSQDTGVSVLLYSTEVSTVSARAYADRVRSASAVAGSSCGTPSGRWVALGLHGGDGTRWDVVDLGCDRILTGTGRTVGVLPPTVRPWAVAGVPAYVSAPSEAPDSLDQYLHAPTG